MGLQSKAIARSKRKFHHTRTTKTTTKKSAAANSRTHSELKSVNKKKPKGPEGAGVVVDGSSTATTMAPALTEPLSPNEKLSSSTATPTTRASSKKAAADADTTIIVAATSSSSTGNNSNNKDKRQRQTTAPSPAVAATPSARVTRSNGKEQAVAVASGPSPAAPQQKCNNNNNKQPNNICNEQMGLSAAALNNNNNTVASKSNNNETAKLIETTEAAAQGQSPTTADCALASVKDTSTEQLLADLTVDDFEEAINAEICLRKQLLGVDLAAKVAAQSQAGAPMADAPQAVATVDSGVTDASNMTCGGKEPLCAAADKLPSVEKAPPVVEALPSISTDSTMTASEVEDNLEERLSQLDGSAAASAVADLPICSEAVPVTPPRMAAQQQQVVLTPQTPHTSYMKETQSGGNTSGGGADIEDQDIEEVLKALKGFDGSSGADALCDLNVFFNEVYTTLNCDEMNNGSAQANNTNASSSISGVSYSMTTAVKAASPLKDKELHADIEKNQLTLCRKIDFLGRRMRKLQARYMCRHASEEVGGLFEYVSRVAIKGGSTGGVSSSTGTTTTEDSNIAAIAAPPPPPPIIAGRPPAFTWQDLRSHPVPATQLAAMLRKLEVAATTQQLHHCSGNSSSGVSSHLHLKKTSKKAAAAAAREALAAAACAFQNVAVLPPHFDGNVAEELTHVAGLLQTELRETQTAIDSDATESSSGAESADEMVTYNNPIQQTLSIGKRAAWRYSRDRAAIATRWSWLLSQIADLEIKIRQHSELHQEIVRAKGAVVCGVAAADNAAAKAPHETANAPAVPSSVNGYMGIMSVNSASLEASPSSIDDGCCRTRGYVAAQFRKRKLLQTTNIHTISKKAARPSNIKCGCQWPLLPCALCTGRTDPTAPRDLPDTMMMADRIALLDPGYHPVLSFPEDVSNSIHFEAVARLPEWQQRVMRCQVKSIAKGVWKAEREAAAAAGLLHGGSGAPVKRRYIKKKDRLLLAEDGKSATAAATTAATTTNTTTTAAAAAAATAATASTTASNSGTTTGAAALMGGASGGGGGGGGNGIGTLSTSTTTPLVANRLTKYAKQRSSTAAAAQHHCQTALSGAATPMLDADSWHQTGDYATLPPRTAQYDPYYNPIPAHSSLISHSSNNKNNQHHYNNNNNNSKQRKYSATTGNASYYNNNSHHHHNTTAYYNHYNSQSNSNGGGDMNFLYTHDNWDSGGGGSGFLNSTRSRNSSPTHGGGYHKYERSLDRKNRSSYDIDNIVIPYSVAAATRVEILPYKEIPTPKWRIIDEIANVDSNAKIAVNAPAEQAESEAPLTNGIKAVEDCLGTEAAVQTADKALCAAANKEQAASAAEPTGDIEKTEEPTETETKLKAEKVDENAQAVENETPEAGGEPAAKKLKTEVAADIDSAIAEPPLAKDVEEANAVLTQAAKEDATAAATEDISDEAMVHRHERALAEERRKFQTFLKFPWSTRSRANRRIDSRAESSGANTPDPTSPAPQTPSGGGGDQESIPSPLAPSTPLNPLDSIAEVGADVAATSAKLNHAQQSSSNSKRYERRRTTSAKKEQRSVGGGIGDLERRSTTPELHHPHVPPYEPLTFPLPEEVFESLLRAMPASYQHDANDDEDDEGAVATKISRSRHSSGMTPASSSRRASKNAATAMAATATVRNYCDSARRVKRGTTTMTPVRLKGSVVAARLNGKLIADEETAAFDDDLIEEDDDDEEEEEEDEEDDDDYPKHHLAPNDDDMDEGGSAIGDNVGDAVNHGAVYAAQLDDYEAYVGGGGGRGSMLGDSESSEPEPFQDDDPNDPEWKGESAERAERLRKKM